MLIKAKIGMKASYHYDEFDGRGDVFGVITEVHEAHIIMTDEDGITYYLTPDMTDEDHITRLYDEKGKVIYDSSRK